VTASFTLVEIDEDEVCFLSPCPTLSAPEYNMSVDMQVSGSGTGEADFER
jgi:hypothetical protein